MSRRKDLFFGFLELACEIYKHTEDFLGFCSLAGNSKVLFQAHALCLRLVDSSSQCRNLFDCAKCEKSGLRCPQRYNFFL